MLTRRYSEADEETLRLLIPAEEDRHLFTRERWSAGYRWYRSENVACLEHHKPSSPFHRLDGRPTNPDAASG